MAAVQTTTSINYRASLPGAPRPALQSDDLDTMTDMTTDENKAPTLPPALPRRSMLRASKLFDAMPLKLAEAADQPALARAPHELYLSSEEDASSSAGDFSEYGGESGDEAPEGEVSRKSSYEDVARAVPVVFAGKPNLVEIPPARGIQRSSTLPAPAQRADTESDSPAAEAPKRHNSQPAFLDTDPFGEPRESVLKRTIGLVRKRSKPFLNMSMANASQPQLGGANNYSTTSLVSQSPSVATSERPSEAEPPARARAPSSPPVNGDGAPVTYQDIMRNVRRSETAPRNSVGGAPRSVSGAAVIPEKKSRFPGLSMGKRRSVRA